MKTQKQLTLRTLAKVRDDFQMMRKKMDNRIGRKANGKEQELKEQREFDPADYESFAIIADNARLQEKEIEKMLQQKLVGIPVYDLFLSNAKGVGPVMSAWILGDFDIHIATTVSKMWQYAGLNPGNVRGKKRMKASEYKPEMGQIEKEITGMSSEKEYVVITNEAVRGDRLTPGFISPFNKKLKTVLLGVLAGSFMKGNSPYRKYYDDYKHRLENESRPIINESGRNRKDDGKPWKDVSKGHRDSAAKRYMIKMFLKDLYVAWRTIEGLPVRPSYAEEYLGKVHQAA